MPTSDPISADGMNVFTVCPKKSLTVEQSFECREGIGFKIHYATQLAH